MDVVAAGGLVGNYQVGGAIAAGLVGGVVFLAIVYTGRASGMTRMDFLHILGSMLTPKASRSTTYSIGLAVHLMMSAVFGLAHAGVLTAIGVTSVGSAAAWALLTGTAHGVGVLAVLPSVLTRAHPLVRTGVLERPGVAMTGYAAMTPVGSLMAHIGFALVAGSLYAAIVL